MASPDSRSARWPASAREAAQYVEQPRRLQLHGHVGQLELDRLEAGDLLAERLALPGVAQRLVVGLLGDADGPGGDVDPARLQRGEHLLQAAALGAAEQVRGGHPDVVEHQLAGLRAAVAELGQVPARPRSPAVAGVDQQHRHARRAPARRPDRSSTSTGSGSACRALVIQVFRPLSDVAVAVAARGRRDALQVAARARLGQRDAGPALAAGKRGQVRAASARRCRTWRSSSRTASGCR